MSSFESIDDYWELDGHTAASLGDAEYFSLNRCSNETNNSKWTPLMYACSKGHNSVVKTLLKQGARKQFSTLIVAVHSGDLETVKAVFDCRLVDKKDNRGWTILFHAVFLGREPCIEFLIANGADFRERNDQGLTPLQIAERAGLTSVVDLLKMQEQRTINVRGLQLGKTYSYSPNKLNSENKENNVVKYTKELEPSPFKTPRKQTPVLSPIGKALLTGKVGVTGKPASSRRLIPEPVKTPQDRDDKDVSAIDKQNQVYCFLKYLNLLKYWPVFREEEVDFETLLTFDDDNLKDVGIRLYGPRRKILVAIEHYSRSHPVNSNFMDPERCNPSYIFKQP